jgi:hypothetical protein
MSESNYEIDQSTVYYFLYRLNGNYYTLFLSFLGPELVHAFAEREEAGLAYIKVKVGEHLFITYLDGPLYLLEYEKDGALEFAGDDADLTLFPSGTEENVDLPPVIDFPTYWTAGVEPLLDLKLDGGLHRQTNGEWVKLTIEGGAGPTHCL